MNSQERFIKITELLKKFKHGEELYEKSAMFNKAIQMMVEGMNEFEVLEQIVLTSEQTQRAFEDYINRDYRPMNFSFQSGDSLRPNCTICDDTGFVQNGGSFGGPTHTMPCTCKLKNLKIKE